ncbi:MAG: hypothetical protein GQ574_19430 [Crocinitomix sp.]|nr:hypothetical protein [Crocinitomix sp.]
MKHLLFTLSTLFVFNGFASINVSGTTINLEEVIGINLNSSTILSVFQTEQNVVEPEIAEKPKKKKKIIKGLVYYLGGGFVLLLIGMIFFIRKKPKRP